MPSREFLQLVEESSYGVTATPVVGTNAFYARLHDSDAFTGQMDITPLTIPYGGGRATPALMVSDQNVVNFRFHTYLYAGTYSAVLMNWLATPINAGRTAPWTTTDGSNLMPPGDLASLTFYHAITQNDGTIDRRKYGGCKAASWTLACSRQSPIALLNVTGQGIRDNVKADGATAGYPDATEFPAPTETQYPSNPYLFSHTSGQLTIGSVRTQYNSVGFNVTNAMDPRWFESTYIQFIRFLGRTTTLTADMHLKVTPADITNWQSKTVQVMSLKFDNGVNTLKLDCLTNNFYTALGRSLPLNQVFARQVTLTNFWDTSTGNDLTLTTT
jgi:hypothetical protein